MKVCAREFGLRDSDCVLGKKRAPGSQARGAEQYGVPPLLMCRADVERDGLEGRSGGHKLVTNSIKLGRI